MSASKSQFERLRAFGSRAAVPLEALAVVFLSYVLINDMIQRLEILPDSTNYIAAGSNFAKHGGFFVYTNWPSRTYEPAVELYTEYPPGYPLYLAAFMLFFDDPLLAAVVGQALSVFLLLVSLSWVARVLELPFPLRIAAYFFVAMFFSYRVIFRIILSETLFIASCLLVAGCCLKILKGAKDSDKDWRLLYLSLFASTSVKFIGVLNLSFLIVPALCRFRGRGLRSGIAAACSVAPVAIWFVRNTLHTGVFTRSHLAATSAFDVDFFTALGRFRTFWGMGSLPLSYFLLFLLLFPLLFGKRLKNDWTVHLAATLGAILTLLGMMILSKTVYFSFLDHRLLSPSYTLIAVGLLSSLHLLSKLGRFGRILYVLPILYLAVNPYFRNEFPVAPHFRIPHPPERELWRELMKVEAVKEAPEVFTDYNFKHQLYADRPVRIVWYDTDIDEATDVQRLVELGRGKPVFLFQAGHPMKDDKGLTIEDHFTKNSEAFGFERRDFGDFRLYARTLAGDGGSAIIRIER